MSKLLVCLMLATLAVVNVLADESSTECPNGAFCKCGEWVGQFCGKRANREYTTDNGLAYGPVLSGCRCRPDAIYQCGANQAGFDASFNTQCFTCDDDKNKPGVDRCAGVFSHKTK